MAPPTTETAASCRVTPDFVLGRSGMHVRFDVLVNDATGKPLVPAEGITWTALTGAVTGGGPGTAAIFTLAEPGGTSEAVEVRAGNATCRARVTVLSPAIPPGKVRAVVTDELTGRPLREALVAVSDSAGDITGSSWTDDNGVAWVPATGEISLTVFHQEYSYLTLAHYDTQKGTRDVWLPLRRNPLELRGGTRGTFFNPPASSNILIGFSGMSTPAMGLNLHERQVSGPSVWKRMSILGESRELKLPAGGYVSVPSAVIKAEYAAPGVAGVCDEGLRGLANPEEAIRSSTCGTRTSWAFSGEMPLVPSNLERLAPGVNALELLFNDPTATRRFYSSVVRDVQFQLRPVPTGDMQEILDYTDPEHYAEKDHDFHQVPLGFQFTVAVPTPPSHDNILLDRLSIAGGVHTAGRGMTLLGLGSAHIQDPTRALQRIQVTMAPAHHGLEGSPYRLLIVASSDEQLHPFAETSASSFLVVPLESLPSNPRSGTPVTPSRGFLPIPGDARFNFNVAPYQGMQGREFHFLTTPTLPDATLLRVLFTDRVFQCWMVLLAPQSTTAGFRLPIPPSPFRDRTRKDDVKTSRSQLIVQVFSAQKADGSALDMMSLAEAEDANLASLSDFTSAFSERDYGSPGVEWLNPDSAQRSIKHDFLVSVSITDFHINMDPVDDGHVVVSIQGGTGCEDTRFLAYKDTGEDQREIYFKLPEDCRGSQVKMTATLVDSHNVPLSPPVFDTVTIDII